MRDQLDLPARPVLFLDDVSNATYTWKKVAAWLSAGAESPKHPFHWPVVSSIATDGGPDARVVVFRRFHSSSRSLTFHTDIRSPKVSQLRRDSRCTFVFYDPAALLQLRVRGITTIHHRDEVARTEFDALLPHTRASYAAKEDPGSTLHPDTASVYPPRPPIDEPFAFEHFATVIATITELDALELHEYGHRRAKLWWDENEIRISRLGP
jgi:hypothetical protein